MASGVRVPKYMSAYPESVAWAYRYGIVCAMRSRGRTLPNQPGGYVMASTGLLRLADRVRREWLRRDRESHNSETGS